MDTSNTVIGKDGYPFVVNSGGNDRRDDCVEELITLGALHNGQINLLNAIGQGTRDSMEASNRNGIAGIKETSDTGRDNIRETSRAGSDNIRETARVGADLSAAISESRAAIERTSGESRLNTAVLAGEIRELIGTTSTTNLLSIKDNGFAIREDGCKTRERVIEEAYRTREKAAEHFAALQLQECKDFAALTAQNAALDAKVSGLKEAICCCIDKSAAETNIKRLESELLDAKFAALDKKGNS